LEIIPFINANGVYVGGGDLKLPLHLLACALTLLASGVAVSAQFADAKTTTLLVAAAVGLTLMRT